MALSGNGRCAPGLLTGGGGRRAIDWQFRVGDKVKLRLVNEMDSDHPMHHPFTYDNTK